MLSTAVQISLGPMVGAGLAPVVPPEEGDRHSRIVDVEFCLAGTDFSADVLLLSLLSAPKSAVQGLCQRFSTAFHRPGIQAA